jgi:predicted phage terminase large subunit-like protein
MWEAAARMFEPPPPEPDRPQWDSPGDLAKAVDPSTIQTPALDLIDQALMDVENGLCDRLIISMPPQEGKSTRVTKVGPLWFLTRNPERRIAVVSYSAGLALTFGRDIRKFITDNQGQEGTLDLGLRISPDNGAASEWTLDKHKGGVKAVGLTGGLTGKPADILFIDDPVSNREQAESPTFRERAKNFWRSVGSTRLAPGAPVILILTRWHVDDMAGFLLSQPDKARWRVINIPAQANHDPDEGETDPLGREPGEWMVSARTNEKTGQSRTPAEWEQIRIQAGPRDFSALYQGSPNPETGNVFPKEWVRYDQPLWIEQPDGSRRVPGIGRDDHELIQSWDLTFKDKPTSDFVVGQVWLRVGVQAYLLDMVRARLNFNASEEAVLAMSAKWPQAVAKFIEDKANGPAVINSLQKRLVGLIPIEPEGSKFARASAVSPLAHAGNIILPTAELLPNVEELIEEAKAFPNGAHDDTIDAMSQGTNRLLLMPLTAADDLVEPDEYEEADLRGYAITPY